MGRPVALLTGDGKVYQVTGDLAAEKNAKLVGHMTHTVELTGDVTSESDGTMKRVKIVPMVIPPTSTKPIEFRGKRMIESVEFWFQRATERTVTPKVRLFGRR